MFNRDFPPGYLVLRGFLTEPRYSQPKTAFFREFAGGILRPATLDALVPLRLAYIGLRLLIQAPAAWLQFAFLRARNWVTGIASERNQLSALATFHRSSILPYALLSSHRLPFRLGGERKGGN
jgi:hypothetical protein